MRTSPDVESRTGPGADTGSGPRPEVTVAMPAYNAARFIRAAIESVLAQQGIELELVVVDDHSADDTVTVVESIGDARLTLLRNDCRRGIGACHNLVLRHSRAPYIAHVDADDVVQPGALRKLVDALAADPGVGQAHCYFFDVDAAGQPTYDAFMRRWELSHRTRPPGLDYRRALRSENVANALRTYPRAALEAVGGFDEQLPFGVDYEMALRIVDRYRITLVPEFLYARRVHERNTTEGLRFQALRLKAAMYRIRRRLIATGRISFIADPALDLRGFLRSRCAKLWRRGRAVAGAGALRVGAMMRWRVWAPVAAILYRWASAWLHWWPLVWWKPRRARPRPMNRLVYYTRVFPVLSETFIQREIAALWQLGVPCDVVAEQPSGAEHFGDQARFLAQRTMYIGAAVPSVSRALWHFVLRRPLTLLNVSLYVLWRAHGREKSFINDRLMLARAVRLAKVLHDRRATHVHAPWAHSDALVSLLAARLARTRYTVQARASDLHKTTMQVGLAERLAHAEFVITNAQYNVAAIRAKLPPGAAPEVHTIYEGVDLSDLVPRSEYEHDGVPLILSVARIVEPKGIEVLLRACRILKDQGVPFRCEIVGGRQANEARYYIAVRRLWRALGLEADVVFLGACPFERVREKYARATMCVLAAVPADDGRRDVTPNTIIEAMAMAVPVISSRSGAIPELIEDGVSGVLVAPRDETALAAAIARLLGDATLRRALGTAARRRAEERFDTTKNAARYAELFGFPAAQRLAGPAETHRIAASADSEITAAFR